MHGLLKEACFKADYQIVRNVRRGMVDEDAKVKEK